MYKRTSIVMVALILALGAGWCTAQVAQGDAGEPGYHGNAGMDEDGMAEKQQYREKLRRRAETMMIFYVADELDLEADREDEFVDVMRDHLKEKGELDVKEMEHKRELAEGLKSEVEDPKELEKTLKELEAVREKRTESEKKMKEKLEGILSVEQLAKFEMAVPRAREEIMRMIQKAKNKGGKQQGVPGKHNMKGSGGPGPQGSPGPKSNPGPKGKMGN